MDASDALATRDLSFRFSSKQPPVLHNLSFQAPMGSITAFLGPNGAGKTTTIKCLLGLLPFSGHIQICGESDPVTQRKHVGAMVETPSFYSHLSAIDNLEIFASYGQHNASNNDLMTLLKQVGLSERVHDPVGQYSMGMKQRLGIARALIGSPKLLILDEPTNGLDPRGMHDIRVLIQNLQAEHQLSVLLSTHLLSEAEALCDWIVVIEKGHIRASGDIKTMGGGQPHFRILHPEQQKLLAIVSQIPIIATHEPCDGGVRVQLLKGNGSDLNRALVDNGIFVSGIIPEENSLEHIFLQLTEASPQ